tara:strand:+ start:220 stop:489 length:270 start_codon:yes stop_codon:yes gene_type:complete
MKNEELLRDQINQLIRAEIQEGINDYVDQLEVVEKGGLGFVGKDEENELKVKVPVSEVDKIIKEYKKIKKREKSNLNTVKLLDKHGRQL